MNLGSTSLGAQFSPIDTGLAPSPFCEIYAPNWTKSGAQISAGAESLDTKALRLIHIWHCQKTKGERSMRMLLRVSIPVETGNAAAKDGTLGSTIEGILADLKPEAAYFFADDNGNRSGSIVFDMKDTSQIPAIAEPWFFAFNAKVSLRPVMTPQDLAKAGPSIGKVAKRYGK
jgi:hypothetical protein